MAAINYSVSVGITVPIVAEKQYLQFIIMSQDSSLGILTGWMVGIRFPTGSRLFSSP
jgi:hypothetical protein